MAQLRPFLTEELLQTAAAQIAAQDAADYERFDGLDDRLLVRGTEMILDIFEGRELERFWNIEDGVFGLEALVINPFLHDDFVADNLHAGFIGVERHPGKTLAVQLAQLVLIIVMVRRAGNHAADGALRDKRVNALGRFGGDTNSLIERGEMIFHDGRDGLRPPQPRGFVEPPNKQRL